VHANEYWEDPERVEDFAGRPPDQRLMELLEAFPEPRRVRVLDLGCAGGRNTIVLAERGFDFHAIDTSVAMVEKARQRVAGVVGRAEAENRVGLCRMEDLGRFESESFDLVVALGIYQSAESQDQWDRAVDETIRVLAPGGRVLVACFSPRSEPRGESMRPVPGAPHMYEGMESGPLLLLEAEELDAWMHRHGLEPIVTTEAVVVQKDSGHRVTVNAFYSKA
jgi:SAM-dependent methyltransferase